jgi:hypothetical protein
MEDFEVCGHEIETGENLNVSRGTPSDVRLAPNSCPVPIPSFALGSSRADANIDGMDGQTGGAFGSPFLKSIAIPVSVDWISPKCFDGCDLGCEVTFDEACRLTHLEAGVFARTQLSSVDIPDSVASILSTCFSKCPKLKAVKFGPLSQMHACDQKALLETLFPPWKPQSMNCALSNNDFVRETQSANQTK